MGSLWFRVAYTNVQLHRDYTGTASTHIEPCALESRAADLPELFRFEEGCGGYGEPKACKDCQATRVPKIEALLLETALLRQEVTEES